MVLINLLYIRNLLHQLSNHTLKYHTSYIKSYYKESKKLLLYMGKGLHYQFALA